MMSGYLWSVSGLVYFIFFRAQNHDYQLQSTLRHGIFVSILCARLQPNINESWILCKLITTIRKKDFVKKAKNRKFEVTTL
jgi:hypothetical protein